MDYSSWQAPNGGPARPAEEYTHTTVDLAEFLGIDIPAATPSSSTSSTTTPTGYYQTPTAYQPHFYNPASSAPQSSSYGNGIHPGYSGLSQWNTHQPPNVPLSTYSSLNGATAGPSQQSSPQMIDPALTVNGYGHSYQHEPPPRPQSQFPSLTEPYQHWQHVQAQAQAQQPQHPVDQQVQQQQQSPAPVPAAVSPQATTAPVPTGPFHNPEAPKPSPQALKERFQAQIRPLLMPTAFTGAGAVNSLVTLIDEFGSQEVDPQTRLDILTKIRDNAGNHYFRAWAENGTAVDIMREWLKAAFNGKSDPLKMDSIMPLLHIIERLPFTLDGLRESKLGKVVLRLTKEPPNGAIQDMASNVERKWRGMARSGQIKSESTAPEDSKAKKRKMSGDTANSGPSATKPPPAKRTAVTSTPSSSRPVVKKEVKAAPVKDAKADSSFFSGPKAKPKLPTFKKAPIAPAAVAATVPSPAFDPFQEALKSMKSKRGSPAAVMQPTMDTTATTTTSMELTKMGKKKKKVTWQTGDKLEAVRYIEKAIYDDDPHDGAHVSHNARDLDRGEGAALHSMIFEETVDWTEPLPIEWPLDLDVTNRGESSIEKDVQAQRESSVLGAIYATPSHIPETPAEPSFLLPEDKVDESVVLLLTGEGFWDEQQQQQQEQAQQQQHYYAAEFPVLVPGMEYGNAGVGGYGVPPAPTTLDLQQILAQLQGHTSFNLPQQQPMYGGEWLQHEQQMQQLQMQPEYAMQQPQPDNQQWGNGNGGNGGGQQRGTSGRVGGVPYKHNFKTKLCNFFVAGRCKFGDQCDFSHDPSMFT